MYCISKGDFYFSSSDGESDSNIDTPLALESNYGSWYSESTNDKSVGVLNPTIPEEKLSSAEKYVNSQVYKSQEWDYSKPGIIEKSGWLKKQSDNILRNWRWRFFVLKNGKLYYYKNPTDSKFSGVLNFYQVITTLKVHDLPKPTSLSISVNGLSYKMSLKSNNHNEIQDWANYIKKHIDNSYGRVKERVFTNLTEKLWKYERISEDFFKNNATTGDLLLFRSKGLSAKIQRGITGSKYDHVAIILCYSSGKVCLFEATQTCGVDILDWEYFVAIGCHLGVERIAYRKLKMERTEEVMMKLENFIKKANGKSYGLSVKKFLPYYQKAEPGDESDFFCSELIASAYQAIGILPTNFGSNNYLPGIFSEERALLLKNAQLGNEQIIDFDL
ncbi:hypothetical protein SteCoe_5936 [Stentor coeruleus]|uniref:PH domain-containing protein n=1 Tax=Stentor coeruleus TaxID=5963 RepID=A0A1R2CR34_9CILI|nr:hypothetical protein SteCoe_5936 [Stentor coeruleus]